jgi:hypothetical protein
VNVGSSLPVRGFQFSQNPFRRPRPAGFSFEARCLHGTLPVAEVFEGGTEEQLIVSPHPRRRRPLPAAAAAEANPAPGPSHRDKTPPVVHWKVTKYRDSSRIPRTRQQPFRPLLPHIHSTH